MRLKQRIDESQPVVIAEYRLLNAIYLDPNLLDSELYSEDLFVHDMCGSIAKAIDTMTTEGTPLNKNSLFQQTSVFDINVTLDIIEAIIDLNTEPVSYIKDIVDVLTTAKRALKSLDHLEKAKTIINSSLVLDEKASENVRKEFEKAEEALSTLQNQSKKVLTTKEWGDQWQDEFDDRKNGKKYFFNEPVLDDIVVDGPIPGTGGLIVAQPGMGKSTVVLKLVNSLINANVPCMFFSLEMGSISTYDRLLATRLQIPYSEIVNPPDEESWYSIRQQVQQERQFLDSNERFRFCEDASISLADIKKGVKRFQEQIGQQYCIIVLDIITMVKDFCEVKGGLGLAQAIEIAVNKMNALSKELGIHYVATAQLNRSGESDKVVDVEDIYRFRPNRSQVKNSGALIERVRYAISLFRPKFYIDQYFAEDEEAQLTQDTIELQLLKQNNGVCKRHYELFDGPTFSLTPLLNTSEDDE